jgi:tRNA-Thr(GGU) m(6)t(6)A37 methyltransferase TsaA
MACYQARVLSDVRLSPIGLLHTPYPDRVSAPRQPDPDVAGTIELFPRPGFEHAVEDLEGWDYLWVIFLFHLNEGWRPKVLPPRSTVRRGLFATRSPHRPNPIGLSAVRLERVEGLTLHVRGVDMIDGSPVLDVKPYVPYADAFPAARTGWLTPLAPADGAPAADPEPGFRVTWSDAAAEQAAYLLREHAIDLQTPVERTLSLGPQPHPYRRIKRDGDALRLAVKDWRVRFRVEGRAVTVLAIATGYRESQLAPGGDPALAPHRAFAERFA